MFLKYKSMGKFLIHPAVYENYENAHLFSILIILSVVSQTVLAKDPIKFYKRIIEVIR
jgi:hypothetical protein